MPLVAASLQSGLLSAFQARPSSGAQAAQLWTSAYMSYSASASSPTGGVATNLAASQPGLQAALANAFADPHQGGPTVAQAIGQALVAFWTPVLFAGAAVGSVLSAAAAGPAAQGALLSAWAGLTQSRAQASDAAQQIAAALDAATHLVIVLDVLPFPLPPVVGPVL